MRNIYGFLAGLGVVFAFVVGATPASAQQSAVCNEGTLARVRLQQQGAGVRNMQACLIKLGISIPAGATGYYGVQTRAAVREFYQRFFGLEHDGLYLGPQGLARIKALGTTSLGTSTQGFQRVQSKEELALYLNQAAQSRTYWAGNVRGLATDGAPPPTAPGAPSVGESQSAGRVSDTNVQVKGIDEPDIVKTDGTNIYFSRSPYGFWRSLPVGTAVLEDRIFAPYPQVDQKTSVISAFPPEALAVASEIDLTGDLMLVRDKKILVVFSHPTIVAYDVADPKKPVKKWEMKLEDNASVLTSRLTGDKMYIVTRQYMQVADPCPIRPLTVNTMPVIIDCLDLYRPGRVVPVDTTYTALAVNPETGSVEKKTAFLGSASDAVLYLSPNALYVATYQPEDFSRLSARALYETAADVFPAAIVEKVRQLEGLNISEQAKHVELETILGAHLRTLSSNEQLRVSNEWQKRLADYVEQRVRDLERTAIVKIPLDTMAIAHTASVPGYPVNQFALDEYEGNLRVAVTVGERSGFFGWGAGSRKTANDVYVLDSSLQQIGSVRDLGLTERIYAVRFIGPRGYLVTFRQIDPFYVLDLSNPRSPSVKGELKIPGYSSYLEPLSEMLVLGVGQDGGQVKASLFDVSNPAAPVEKDKYTLQEGWSEALSNHHAFLRDDVHKIFFIPGGNGGYVFSYANDKLSLVKAVSGYSVKRAIYLNDYLYIIGEDKITVLDEKTWQEVKTLDLK
jgi:inhibitor of cysteine peptidase